MSVRKTPVALTKIQLCDANGLPQGANGRGNGIDLGVRDLIRGEALSLADYETALRGAWSRGVRGGGLYDSLHATYARRKEAARMVTRNLSHFHHVAPDIQILTPG